MKRSGWVFGNGNQVQRCPRNRFALAEPDQILATAVIFLDAGDKFGLRKPGYFDYIRQGQLDLSSIRCLDKKIVVPNRSGVRLNSCQHRLNR
jgi:hypothetical protein